jgi:hypothetical protein
MKKSSLIKYEIYDSIKILIDEEDKPLLIDYWWYYSSCGIKDNKYVRLAWNQRNQIEYPLVEGMRLHRYLVWQKIEDLAKKLKVKEEDIHVLFKDGNTLNISKSNLLVVHREESGKYKNRRKDSGIKKLNNGYRVTLKLKGVDPINATVRTIMEARSLCNYQYRKAYGQRVDFLNLGSKEIPYDKIRFYWSL